ncbi:MAG: hypothetical protein HY664_05595, partial [Chloroflexi bacterium]|nr:hypothetical protein [Chloroflexota bacterium]
MNASRLSQRVALGTPTFRIMAVLFSLGSAVVHLAVAPEHFTEWWGYGWFFLVVAVLQGFYAMGLVVRKGRLVTAPWYLIFGIAFNLWVAGFYSITRTLGVPLFGPHAGHVEVIEAIDISSKTLELGTAVALSALLLWHIEFRQVLMHRLKWVAIALLGVTATLVLLEAMTLVRGDEHGILLSDGTFERGQVSDPNSPAIKELFPLLVRFSSGSRGTEVEAFYAPPIYFQASGVEVPKVSLERSTIVFFLAEADHQHEVGLTPEPPRTLLRLDGGDPIEPYQVTVLNNAFDHRTSQLLFYMSEGMSQELLDKGEHTLSLALFLESGGESVISWHLPLALPGSANSATPQLQVLGLAQRLTRTRDDMQYGGRKGIRIEGTYATPEYVAAAMPKDATSRYLPDKFTLFVLTERLHSSELPSLPPDVVMRLDGQTYKPNMVEVVTTSPHHRVTLVRFPTEPPTGLRHRVMELSLPGEGVMTWHLPISYAGLGYRSGLGGTWLWLLAVLGGLIAAMWPCLFQLTAFFIPSLAGLSVHEASSNVSLRRRASVVKAAIFFVLGFTFVYTIAGGLIGFAAGRLGDISSFYVWQRYLGIAGGVVIVLLALRMAAQVRAPLVCKMPVLSRIGQRRRPANPLEMMVAGVAFASGCMTCFGAATVVAMVAYVGLSGSALVGAFTLFL